MINEKIEYFLEKVDMNYLFCLLSKLEAQRLNQFPAYVKNKFGKRIPVLSMEHVADNEVPDYITELAEAELAREQENSPFANEEAVEYSEETIDDSKKFIEDLGAESLDYLSDDDNDGDDFFGEASDAEDLDED